MYRNLPPKPYDKISDFDQLDQYFQKYDTVQFLAVVVLVIQIYSFIQMMNAFFPSFGMLFATFRKAAKDISQLLIIYLIIMVGFIIAVTLMFGGT